MERVAPMSVMIIAFAACAPASDEELVTPTVDQPPVAVLDVAREAFVGEELLADGTASFDTDGEIVDAVLVFGDGSEPALRLSARHAFTRPGRFVVELLVEDDAGGRARARVPVVVRAP